LFHIFCSIPVFNLEPPQKLVTGAWQSNSTSQRTSDQLTRQAADQAK
jgi:hypothetical protein